jgi:hypothetical protein
MARTPQANGGELTAVRRAEEQVLCYQLRLKGHNLRDIAKMMTERGYPMSHVTVSHRVAAEIKERIDPGREAHRALMVDRLDGMLVLLSGQIERDLSRVDGEGNPAPVVNLDALKSFLAIEDRRAKLLGLDEPAKLEVFNRDNIAPEADVQNLIKKAEAAIERNRERDEWARERLQR